jgi:peptidoglycan/LPS O-acetylase OafA/YrhL
LLAVIIKGIPMIKYRTEIDGLRTIAVIPVILFHLGYSFVKGGYMGVDVFFVISGYLITKLLTDDIVNENFSMYRFWIRRVKRLLPLLLTVVLLTLIVAPLLVFKPFVKDITNDIFPAIFSYFNFHALYDFGNYWGGKAEQSFFLHTWSLSVEEQFYLLYPPFLFLSHKYFKNFVIPILTITILSFCLFFFYLKINKEVDTAFYLLPTRIWELSIGGLAGVINLKKLKALAITPLFPIAGICFIVCAYLLGSKTIGYSVLLPVTGSVFIILFCTPNDIVGKILSSKLFVLIGKISYSLYLWHWGIIVLFKNLHFQLQDINHHFLNAFIITLTFLLSYLSYTFIENKTRNYQHTPKIVLAGIALIVGFAIYFQSPFYNPYYNSRYNQQDSYAEYYDISPTQTILQAFLDNDNLRYNVTIPKKLQKYNDAYKKEGIITNEKNGKPKIMLIGDSHGVMWAKLINEISDEFNVSLSCYTSNGSNPFFNLKDINSQKGSALYTQTQRIDYAKSIIENIENWKPKLIVLVCRWERQNEETTSYLNELLSFLEKRNIKTLLFTQPPALNFMPDKNASQYFTYLDLNPIEGCNLINVNNSVVIKNNDYIKSLTLKYTNVVVYDVYENMTQDNKVKISLGKEALYFDDDHLSYYGTFIHKENISSIINLLAR